MHYTLKQKIVKQMLTENFLKLNVTRVWNYLFREWVEVLFLEIWKLRLVKDLKYTTGDYLPLTEGWTKWSKNFFFSSLTLECAVSYCQERHTLWVVPLTCCKTEYKQPLVVAVTRKVMFKYKTAVLVKASVTFRWLVFCLRFWLVQVFVMFLILGIF